MNPHENGINTVRSRRKKLRSDRFAVYAVSTYSKIGAMK